MFKQKNICTTCFNTQQGSLQVLTIPFIYLISDRTNVSLLQEVQPRNGERRRQQDLGHAGRVNRQGRGQQLQIVRTVLLDPRKVRENGKLIFVIKSLLK